MGHSYNDKGEEILDTTPVSIPVSIKPPMPLNERIKQMIRYEASLYAQQNGQETFDEADDFEVGDKEDFHSPWEENFDPQVPFIGTREEEIKRGLVTEIDETKINSGVEELKKYTKKPEIHKKTKKLDKSKEGDEVDEE